MKKTYPIYYDGTLSDARAKELEKIAIRSAVGTNKDVKLSDEARRFMSGNPYTRLK